MASVCPYCAEPVELVVDSSVELQVYIEDCPVCCRPITVEASAPPIGPPQLILRREDET